MIVVFLAGLGLVFGSFVNAFVWRLHEQEDLREQIAELDVKKASAKKLATLRAKRRERSMLHGRSMCTHCHHELAPKDLVPVLSWLWLRGKCRYCGVKIEDNPLPELALAVLLPVSYLCWPLLLHGAGLFQFIVWLGFLVAFVALAAYDLRWFILPDRITLPLAAVAALEVISVAIWDHDAMTAVWAALGALTLSGLFYVLFKVSDGNWIGGGDVKLAITLGLLAGSPVQSLLLLFFSSVIGTACSVPILLQGRNGLKKHVPFGPFLLAATFMTVLWGQRIIDWYANLVAR